MISDGLFRQVGLFSTELPVGGAREYTWLPIAMFVLALFSQKLTDLDVSSSQNQAACIGAAAACFA